jgi:hypothetical protein
MFQSLTDQQTHASSKELMIRVAVIAVISILLFVALYLGVRSAG